jgi:hypothetical protein
MASIAAGARADSAVDIFFAAIYTVEVAQKMFRLGNPRNCQAVTARFRKSS